MRKARRDTGQPPSHADWLCLATAGRDGNSITVRGTFNETAEYRRLDVVALNGGSFVALKDKPGPCPGSGWQLVASQGKRGVAGERGERGPPGARGDARASSATIWDWKIDRARYVATPFMRDGGEGPPLELRGLFEPLAASDHTAAANKRDELARPSFDHLAEVLSRGGALSAPLVLRPEKIAYHSYASISSGTGGSGSATLAGLGG